MTADDLQVGGLIVYGRYPGMIVETKSQYFNIVSIIYPTEKLAFEVMKYINAISIRAHPKVKKVGNKKLVISQNGLLFDLNGGVCVYKKVKKNYDI